MQLDQEQREGIDESSLTQQKCKEKFDLGKYFKQHGVSAQAYAKMADDVASGDMNQNVLMDCEENELNDIADGYNFTWLQKKTFVKAVKLLKKSSANTTKAQSQEQEKFIYVSPNEQAILDEINALEKSLKNYANKCVKIKEENKNKLESEILKLQHYSKFIQTSFDNAINSLIEQCKNEMNDDEKSCSMLKNDIAKQENDLKNVENQFKEYLNKKSNAERTNDQVNNDYNNISDSVKEMKSNVNKLLSNCNGSIVSVEVKNEINENGDDPFASQFIEKLHDLFSVTRFRTTKVNKINGAKESDNDEKKEIASNQSSIVKTQTDANLKQRKNIWRFNFHYDFRKRGSEIHGIEKHGKSMRCDWKCDDTNYCGCFSSITNIGMEPNTGIYSIKIKIDNTDNTYIYNTIIGITSEKYDSEKMTNSGFYTWQQRSNNYIGWSSSATDWKDDKVLPNGLLCGFDSDSQKNNIFRTNNFVYKSKNENYKKQLPGFKNDDIVVLSYDSQLNQLSFHKENDNGKLNSFIKNLPKHMTFYWFVGHYDRNPMSICIVD